MHHFIRELLLAVFLADDAWITCYLLHNTLKNNLLVNSPASTLRRFVAETRQLNLLLLSTSDDDFRKKKRT